MPMFVSCLCYLLLSVLNVTTWFLLVFNILLMVHIYSKHHFYIRRVLNMIFLVSY